MIHSKFNTPWMITMSRIHHCWFVAKTSLLQWTMIQINLSGCCCGSNSRILPRICLLNGFRARQFIGWYVATRKLHRSKLAKQFRGSWQRSMVQCGMRSKRYKWVAHFSIVSIFQVQVLENSSKIHGQIYIHPYVFCCFLTLNGKSE